MRMLRASGESFYTGALANVLVIVLDNVLKLER